MVPKNRGACLVVHGASPVQVLRTQQKKEAWGCQLIFFSHRRLFTRPETALNLVAGAVLRRKQLRQARLNGLL